MNRVETKLNNTVHCTCTYGQLFVFNCAADHFAWISTAVQ